MNGGTERKRTADAILAASVLAAAAAAPVSASFWGGLVFHTALAAAVGGAADWFAVNSLFRRPLGIPFRTELVPRSRGKIIGMARDMVEKEILTVPRLYRILKQHSPSAAFFSWLTANRESLRPVLEKAAEAVVSEEAAARAAGLSGGCLQNALQRADWSGVLRTAVRSLSPEEAARLFCPPLKLGLKHFLREAVSEGEWLSLYREAWERYEGKGSGRAMLRGLLQSQLGLTDDKAAALIEEKVMDWAEAAGDPESAPAKSLAAAYAAFGNRLETDEAFSAEVNRVAGEAALRWCSGGADGFSRWCIAHRKGAAALLAKRAEEWLLEKGCDEAFLRRTDRWLLLRAAEYLPRLHRWLGDSAEAALSRYSAKEMADLVEQGVWHDLQMIRVNGSAIGALLGGAAYLAFYVLSGGAVL